ncbi:MAG: ribosome small subunit-dependent GTPase A, partial [Phycisphaerae bacterium]|nr:ribosome small subunit-dependent GTPase A [Gemmatimonadaceae bacterium]
MNDRDARPDAANGSVSANGANASDGVVLSGTGGTYQVLASGGATVESSLRGRLKHGAPKKSGRSDGSGEARPLKLAVGDRVTLERDSDSEGWSITSIHPRSGRLARRAPGGARGERVIVANVDQVVVVFAAAQPEPHPKMLDRFLVIAEANDLKARIVINKMDLAGASDAHGMFDVYARAGYPVHYTSVKQVVGLEELRAQIQGQTSALTGPSGVGKSSLMNALFPGLNLRTAEISESVNKGRHTTVGALLYPLPGGNGFVADTPGLREVGLWGISVSDVDHCFPEFRPLLGQCRFADCTHLV